LDSVFSFFSCTLACYGDGAVLFGGQQKRFLDRLSCFPGVEGVSFSFSRLATKIGWIYWLFFFPPGGDFPRRWARRCVSCAPPLFAAGDTFFFPPARARNLWKGLGAKVRTRKWFFFFRVTLPV